MKIICNICGNEYDRNEHYCPSCGAETPHWKKNPNLCRCPDCGSLISKKTSVCPHCGHKFGRSGGVVVIGISLLIMSIVLMIGIPSCTPRCEGTVTLKPIK